jgi:heavy metal sensor kinase
MKASPRTLWGRLALWFSLVLVGVLLAFSAAVLLIFAADEAAEPPAVKALEGPDHVVERVLVAVAIALPGSLALALGGGWWIARRSLAPLRQIVAVTGELGADQLARRLPEAAGAAEEIAQLTAALNQMLERLERSVAAMRRFTADASHELRTPITILMGEIELALRRPREPAQLTATLEASLEELGHLARLTDALLTLARSDSGELPLEPVERDLVELVRTALVPYEAVMSARGVALKWSGVPPVRALVDPLWLGRALANLIDNACKFTPDGGEVAVAVERQDGVARICVADSGPGLSPLDRARMFERFYRGEAARAGAQGFGLGLALAREIVRAQGGALEAGASAQGGAELRIVLPARG